MYDSDFKRDLINYISQKPNFKKISYKQFALKCPFCGDSRKDQRAAHFYILIDTDSDDVPVLYNCYRSVCQVSGLADNEMLRALELYDLNLSGALLSYNKKVKKKIKGLNVSETSLNLRIPPIRRDDPNALGKKKYLEDRLGIEIGFETLEMLKVVFSLGDLVRYNRLAKLTVDKNKALDLDKNYIGFLSAYDEKLIMRQVYESKYLRYENYIVDKDILNVKKFYSIPTVIDLLSPQPIEINIAEGVMDIFGIYFNVHNGGRLNSLYLAATGSNFRSVIDFVLKLGFTTDVILNIYSDAEVHINAYTYIYREYGDWFDEINIYYNTLSKDTGVPRDQINLIKKKPKWVK